MNSIKTRIKRSAKDWEEDFIFVVEPDEDLDHEVYYFLGLYPGDCTDAALLEDIDERDDEFLFRAPYGSWRGEIAYTPFGETRSSLGTSSTDYRYREASP